MATVDGITAAKAQEIEDASVVSGIIDSGTGHLILTTAGGITIDAGLVVDTAGVAAHAADTSTHGVGQVVGATETQTLTNKTLTSPILTTPYIASFVNAQHNHADNAGGGRAYPFSGMRCLRTTTQTIGNDNTSLVSFTATATYDTDAYKTSNTVFTIPATGKYDIQVIVPWEANATGRRSLDLRLNSTDASANGVSLCKQVTSPGLNIQWYSTVSVTAEPLVTGDYVSAFVYQNSGSGLLINGNNNDAGARTLITIRRVG